MSESSRKAVVVPVVLEPHGNADSLSIIRVDGFQVVGNTAAWTGVDKAVYIEPETIVDTTRPEFSFLKREGRDKEVIRAKRLRGVWSLGMLAPCPEGFNLGDNAWDYYGLEHYEPEEQWVGGVSCGDAVPAPPLWANLPKYDVENYRKYGALLADGELIGVTEKYHGSNWAAVYSDGAFHVKSRGFWRAPNCDNDYGMALEANPAVKKYLQDNPNTLACGEIIGKIQKGFPYSIQTGGVGLRLFDFRRADFTWVHTQDFRDIVEKYDLPAVKVIGGSTLIKHDRDLLLQLSEGKTSQNADHMREGIVIRPAVERFEHKLNGRLILKLVSNKYLEKQSA